MNNKILALKYRPRFFDQVIGQDFCVQSLQNSINLNKLHNAYLFSGTRGVGKTTIARIFAKSLLCKEGISETPCGKCDSCLSIDNNNNLDLIEIDAASRTKVEDTRTLMENVQYAPTSSRFKIYLIDEVHMLSTKSFNALLKTVEEPPEHVKFLLATTDPDKLPETVISRCLHFKLESISQEILSEHIKHTLTKENIVFETNTPEIIAEAAKGSARDSMSILEQCISYGNGNLIEKDISKLLGIIDEKVVDEIIVSLHQNNLVDIKNILETKEINNYSKLLDRLIERVFQISIARASKNNDSLPDIFFKGAIKLEDLQLWYSILIQAKEDFDKVTSKPDHLLMILLRITLFTEYPSVHSERVLSDGKDAIINNQKEKTDNLAIKKKAKIKDIDHNTTTDISLDSWETFVNKQDLQGLMLDLSQNSILHKRGETSILVIDSSKKNTYPKKCIDGFIEIIIKNFDIHPNSIITEIQDQVLTLYKKSVSENIKSKEDMYNSIKDNNLVKEIENVFDAKIDKDNISKL